MSGPRSPSDRSVPESRFAMWTAMRSLNRSVMRSLARPVRRLVGATCLMYLGGIGDHLLLTTLARELKRRGRRYVFIISPYPGLYLGNRDIDGVAAPESRRAWTFMKLAGDQTILPTYMINHNPITDEKEQPPDPILAYMCRKVGITGRVDVRPYMTLSEEELAGGAPYRGCIAVQSSGLSARWPMLNKQWPVERMAEVAAHLNKSHPVVQIGSPDDPPVPRTHDLRGTVSLRQFAAVLANCRMLVGLVGMPMHMARAVDCPSVIVYGGRERPDQTGYICNENLYSAVPCAPCWLDSNCDHGRICLDMISSASVIESVERMLSRPREGLAVASYEIV
jgi:Glycosyltransferase family 9 (heptosyltransferase)